MFADQLRAAITRAHPSKLVELSTGLWKAYAAGGVTEPEAEELTALLEARKTLPPAAKPSTLAARARSGSRPRTDASMARRRSWAATGRMPPALAARFTLAEQAVLAVVAMEVEKASQVATVSAQVAPKPDGACTLTLGHIAALAGVCKTTVRNALRQAERLQLVKIEERRLTAWRNAPNRVTVVSPEWLSWLRMRNSQGGGRKSVHPTSTQIYREAAKEGFPGRGGGIFAQDGSRQTRFGGRSRPSG